MLFENAEFSHWHACVTSKQPGWQFFGCSRIAVVMQGCCRDLDRSVGRNRPMTSPFPNDFGGSENLLAPIGTWLTKQLEPEMSISDTIRVKNMLDEWLIVATG